MRDCPDTPLPGTPTLNHWGRARALAEGGRLVALVAPAHDPAPSALGEGLGAVLDGPLRIRRPMVRAGWLADPRGSGAGRGREPFVELSWERALDLVAAEVERVRREHGNAAIFGGSYGWASAGRFHHAQSQLHRFLNLAGGCVRSVTTHSHGAAEVILPHITGSLEGLTHGHTPWSLIAGHCDLFLAFGGLPLRNTAVQAGGVARHEAAAGMAAAAAAGTRFVNLSPLRGDADERLGAEWLPLRPGSDAALMLALAHTLIAEGLHDPAFLAGHCAGAERFAAHLAGADGTVRDADWAAAITGLPAETIRALARRMAAGRTMVSVGWALQRARHGEQVVWAGVALAAVLGQIGLPGGGFGLGYGSAAATGAGAPDGLAWPALPQGRNPVAAFIPVARLTDMLLNPGASFTFDGRTHRYPDIRLVWWAGGNPFHHQADLNKLRRGWARPETVIVHEPFWNALARHADIVLPATLPVERNDLGLARAEGHLVAMKQAVAPPGEARSDFDILRALAARLGFGAAFDEGRDEMGWIRHLYAATRAAVARAGGALPEFEAFWAAGEARAGLPAAPRPLLAAFRADPRRHPLATPSGRIELASDRIAAMGLPDCGGLPDWRDPGEWAGAAGRGRFGLHLVSPQPARRLHSQLDHGPHSRAGKVAGREPVLIHPADAAARGIADGAVVRLWNDRGACLAGAVVTEAVRPGVVALATGAWYDPDPATGLCRHGNPNVLTSDLPTSALAQGSAVNSALVEAEPFAGPVPPVAAFDPPPVLPGAAPAPDPETRLAPPAVRGPGGRPAASDRACGARS